ncbi:preprotein translocase subunit SecE [Coxiella endosymbiont of Dermacentor marginatus]|uniref:preprotein translocase subunit SecE n=1 Tax=Coxiella endosymbiont of Dermacentor marginatus TaxID=1656159 RepID=UPI0022230FC5|nr:preprotein translocase subunit SecE [Coxiella endosymbiont of Dermacentor marginatus]
MAQQNAIQNTKSSWSDALKWFLVILLFALGLAANFYYSHVVVAVRAAVGIVLTTLALIIASQTQRGQKTLGFIRSSRIELHKVVWPTRQETVQTMLVVVVMVIVTALILWGLDSFFMWAISWMTGQRRVI